MPEKSSHEARKPKKVVSPEVPVSPPGRDDTHEQREPDQRVEGVVHATPESQRARRHDG